MASQEELLRVIDEIHADVDGFIGASIVDMDSGTPLASRSTRSDFDLDLAASCNSAMVKAKLETIAALKINTGLEDMLLTLGTQVHLITMIDPRTFLYVAADRASTHLSQLRSTVTRHAADVHAA